MHTDPEEVYETTESTLSEHKNLFESNSLHSQVMVINRKQSDKTK